MGFLENEKPRMREKEDCGKPIFCRIFFKNQTLKRDGNQNSTQHSKKIFRYGKVGFERVLVFVVIRRSYFFEYKVDKSNNINSLITSANIVPVALPAYETSKQNHI
jgi:hypothetical protein